MIYETAYFVTLSDSEGTRFLSLTEPALNTPTTAASLTSQQSGGGLVTNDSLDHPDDPGDIIAKEL